MTEKMRSGLGIALIAASVTGLAIHVLAYLALIGTASKAVSGAGSVFFVGALVAGILLYSRGKSRRSTEMPLPGSETAAEPRTGPETGTGNPEENP